MLRVTTFDSFRLHSRNLFGYAVHTLARSRALPSQPVPISGFSARAVGARLRGHVLRGLDAPFSAGGGSLWPSRHGYSSLHSLYVFNCLYFIPFADICQHFVFVTNTNSGATFATPLFLSIFISYSCAISTSVSSLQSFICSMLVTRALAVSIAVMQ